MLLLARYARSAATNVEEKVEPHQRSVLIVFPSQMLKYIRFFEEYGVCVDKENTS